MKTRMLGNMTLGTQKVNGYDLEFELLVTTWSTGLKLKSPDGMTWIANIALTVESGEAILYVDNRPYRRFKIPSNSKEKKEL